MFKGVQRLPSQYEALSSNRSIAKRKPKKIQAITDGDPESTLNHKISPRDLSLLSDN
jgi:hypothetical protein